MPEIQSNEIHLWLVEDPLITDAALLASYRTLLNPEENTRYERFVFPKHKKQFLVSRALLRAVLGSYLDIAPKNIAFAQNAYGKPRIANAEQEQTVNFNLSHTEGLCVLAVTMNQELGVDIEYLTRNADTLKLAQRYFSAQEAAALQALDASQLNDRFFDLWTLKEAYIKACGMGLAIPLKDFTFQFHDKALEISFAAEREDHPEHWQFWQYRFKDQFQLALALRDESSRYKKQVILREGVPLRDFQDCEPELRKQSMV